MKGGSHLLFAVLFPTPELKKVHACIFCTDSGPRKYTLEYKRFDSKKIERKLKIENWSKLHVHSMILGYFEISVSKISGADCNKTKTLEDRRVS